MSTVSLRLPNFLHKEVKEYLESRALRGNREKFDHALSKIGRNNPPDKNDVEIK
ncbi:MAG: hypothetical protein JRJ37_03785 [Deltaproteobacteria bacterium]|nr:hypothetical protein [Deltaproteobacteria bacterium]